jgi:dipeptidyl-peptidase-4
MRKLLSLLVLISVYTLSFAGKGGSNDILKDITDGKFKGETPATIHPMMDGESYTQLSDNGKQIIKYSYKTGKQVQVLFDADKTRGAKVKSIEGYFFSPTEKLIMVYTNSEKLYRHSFVADYYLYDWDRNKMDALSDSTGKLRDPVFSPSGRMVVFGKGQDLRLKKLDYGTETIVTKSGENGDVFNGVTDWLYEEEFGVTNLIVWSPDSKYFAYVSLDESKVGTQHFDVYGKYPYKSDEDLYPTEYSFKFPKAGTPNPVVSLNIFEVLYKNTKKIELNESGEFYIPRLKWINETEDIAVFTLSRNQDVMKMYTVNYKSLIFKVLLEEHCDKYYDFRNLDYVTFLKDNKFTIASETDGYRHLYLYNANGLLNKQLTSGKYDVTGFCGVDTVKNIVYYQAAEISPLGREVYSVDLKGKKTLLTEAKGTSTASFNQMFTYFVKESSTATTPTQYTVCTSSGKSVRVLEDNADLSQVIAELPKKEFLTIKNAENIDLNAWMLKPQGFDASKKYPVVMFQYSGPDDQEVLDEYNVGLEQKLVEQGFIVVCVDGRGTGARGEQFRKSTYMNLGELESKDQVAAAKYLGSLPYVDKNKIGIWGWSYGGYNTLMSMSTGEKVFAAGVAVAPLTDWKFYDTAYTERYMRRPQENGAYDKSSPIAQAAKLNGKLLLVAGTADDNTHIQNVYAYSEQLVQANKQFDMQIYTNRNHGLKGGNTRYHLYTRITQFFIDNLK